MPFVSRSQLRACFALRSRAHAAGKESTWDCDKWYHETPDFASLPERIHPQSSSYVPRYIPTSPRRSSSPMLSRSYSPVSTSSSPVRASPPIPTAPVPRI